MSASHQTELLSPAGDWESLRAAVIHGANAVYFGLSDFNARHRATNFKLDELPQIVEYLHARNVRGYVTLNTLIFSDELVTVADYVRQVAEAGVDAVIVQDLGLARLIRQVAPELAIHASTQTTQTEPRGIELLRSLGISRVILARELSLSDIHQIAASTSMPLEVFVHGALCVAYSGQCLTSEALGGRSANRGQCAQACRLPYDLIVDGQHRELGDQAYLLSPQDLAAYDLVKPLVEEGVCSLKIEGRLKSAQYVAVATQTYRAALDDALAGKAYEIPQQQSLDLAQSFSRGFAPGFLGGVNHQQLVHGRFPKSRGVYVGQIVRISGRAVQIELDPRHQLSPLAAGDGIVFDEGHPDQEEQGGRLYAVRQLSPRRVEIELQRDAFRDRTPSDNARVWKTDDPALRKRVAQSLATDRPAERTALTFSIAGTLGGPLRLSAQLTSVPVVEASWDGPLAVAQKHPWSQALLEEQLGRLGDTPFTLGELKIDLPEQAMVPKSVLNDLRRQVVTQLLEHAQHVPPAVIKPALDSKAWLDLRREAANTQERTKHADKKPSPAHLSVLVRSLAQLDAVLQWHADCRPSSASLLARESTFGAAQVICDFEDPRYYREAILQARRANVPIALATLRVVKPADEGLLEQIGRYAPDAILVRNLAALAYYREKYPETRLLGDYSLNVANELTADFFRRQGLARLTPSYDLDWQQLAAMLKRIDPTLFEIVAHQHMPMFHMEHCVFAATLSDGKDHRDCGRPCDHHRVDLRDRTGANLPLVADIGCRNTVFNSVAQSAAEYLPRMLSLGVRWFRVELLRQTQREIGPLLDVYARVLSGTDPGQSAYKQLGVLNQLGVTRGTLEVIQR